MGYGDSRVSTSEVKLDDRRYIRIPSDPLKPALVAKAGRRLLECLPRPFRIFRCHCGKLTSSIDNRA